MDKVFEACGVPPDRELPPMIRKDSVMAVPGREGQELTHGSGAGKTIGVFTSGGDSQGT